MTNHSKSYNYYDFIIEKGRKIIHPNFNITDQDWEIIKKLLAYFLENKAYADKYGIDLNKGLVLSGPIGCGKTSFFKIIHVLSQANFSKCKFRTHTCREVSFEFASKGIPTILDYSTKSFSDNDKSKPLIKLFDDLGAERSIKHFGNEMNIMAEILISRYELFTSHKMLTYITTNLNASEIGQVYGDRVRSRIREMCNLIAFPEEMKDKRV